MYTWIMKRDINLKLLKSEQVLKIKEKRAKFRRKQKAIIAKQKSLTEGKRNYGNISNRQVKKYDSKVKNSIKLRKKYKYEQKGGDIAYRQVITDTNWIDNFSSSNVYKFQRRGNNLMVMFLDGSAYIYFGVGNKFIGLLNAGSKGKWIWKQLREQSVNYAKIR